MPHHMAITRIPLDITPPQKYLNFVVCQHIANYSLYQLFVYHPSILCIFACLFLFYLDLCTVCFILYIHFDCCGYSLNLSWLCTLEDPFLHAMYLQVRRVMLIHYLLKLGFTIIEAPSVGVVARRQRLGKILIGLHYYERLHAGSADTDPYADASGGWSESWSSQCSSSTLRTSPTTASTTYGGTETRSSTSSECTIVYGYTEFRAP